MSHREDAALAARVEPGVAWFCIRSQPKHEHIAASQLRAIDGVEVLNPRIRFARSTVHGPVMVTEAMFPSYLFARFDWRASLNRVNYALGVSCVVHFGSKWPTVPEAVIEELRASLGTDELRVMPTELAVGDTVELSGGAFHGLQAVITQVMTGKQRVLVLMDFLGRQTSVEVETTTVVKQISR